MDKKINIDFHGNKNFFNLIKGIANDFNENNENQKNVQIIGKYIKKIFGGLEIDIDIDLNFKFEDFYEELYFLNEKNHNKITSEIFFKEIYNFVCRETKDLLSLEIKDVDKKHDDEVEDEENDSEGRRSL